MLHASRDSHVIFVLQLRLSHDAINLTYSTYFTKPTQLVLVVRPTQCEMLQSTSWDENASAVSVNEK